MFIISKRNFLIQIPGRAPYRIPKDYIGEIPAHWMVQAAICSGMISTPVGKKDNQLEAADEVAEEKAAATDIRPDAQKPAEDVLETDSENQDTAAGKKSRKSAEK